jgi:GDP-4-dehydro-6-deoxy-D-mannose reductase
MRDFTDVRDTVRAYALALEIGKPGEVYNIASGAARTLRDLLMAMIHVAGIEADIRQAASLQRAAEPALLVGDASKLRNATGWSPERSFERSAADTLAYWQDRIGQIAELKGKA